MQLRQLTTCLILAATPNFASADIILVSDLAADNIEQFTSTGTPSVYASGLPGGPQGMAFDSAGNLYVANANTSGPNPESILKIPQGGGSFTSFATGFSNPVGLAFDSAGNLYVANANNNTITKTTPGGVTTVFATGLNVPTNLAFDNAGNLYVSNGGSSTIMKFAYSNGSLSSTPTLYASTGLDAPNGIAFDSSGNLYAANYYSNMITKTTPGGVTTDFASLANPIGIAFDSSGNLYAVDNYDGEVEKYQNVNGTLSKGL